FDNLARGANAAPALVVDNKLESKRWPRRDDLLDRFEQALKDLVADAGPLTIATEVIAQRSGLAGQHLPRAEKINRLPKTRLYENRNHLHFTALGPCPDPREFNLLNEVGVQESTAQENDGDVGVVDLLLDPLAELVRWSQVFLVVPEADTLFAQKSGPAQPRDQRVRRILVDHPAVILLLAPKEAAFLTRVADKDTNARHRPNPVLVADCRVTRE